MAKGTVRQYKVVKAGAGKRADVYVAKQLPEFTRSSLKGLFEKGFVTQNSKVIRASQKLNTGGTLEVDLSLLSAEPGPIDIPIIYEDDDAIVLNKPAGILTHSKGALNTEATVASFIKPMLNDKKLTGNRAGIVHRLDRATSGVIIIAKNEPALKYLQTQFSTRKVNKTYAAIVEGELKLKEAIINAPIERNPKKPQTFRVGGGKQAVTYYKVQKILNPETKILNTLSIPNRAGKTYSLLELRPKTGRTHQLRVHLKYIGHPILGDRVYGRDGEHMYLLAKSLELKLPSGRQMKFIAPEPKDFKLLIRS